MGNGTGAELVQAMVVPGPERDRIMRHLQAALPNEGVGLLAVEWAGTPGERIGLARKFYPGTNIRASPVRYEMDRLELIAALREIDDNGWALGAIVHSHPHGPPTPSRTDLAEAFYPESLLAIVSFAGDVPEFQAWQLIAEDGQWNPRSVPILACEHIGNCSK
jgi:proteasome lid subunit RPN8/RPN11